MFTASVGCSDASEKQHGIFAQKPSTAVAGVSMTRIAMIASESDFRIVELVAGRVIRQTDSTALGKIPERPRRPGVREIPSVTWTEVSLRRIRTLASLEHRPDFFRVG